MKTFVRNNKTITIIGVIRIDASNYYTDEQILDFLIVLEQLKKGYEKDNAEWSSFDLNYEHLKDSIIITSSWSTPEEGGDYNCVIRLKKDQIEVETVDQGYTVYGDYDNKDISFYKSLKEYGDYLIKYFNIFEDEL